MKLGDFGTAKNLLNTVKNVNSITGTPLFFSPEIIKGGPHSFKSDVWSIGVLFHQILSLKYPFYDSNFAGLLTQILEIEAPELPSVYSLELRSFVKSFLEKDENKRPEMNDLCCTDFFLNSVQKFPTEFEMFQSSKPTMIIRITEQFLLKEFEATRVVRSSENQSMRSSMILKASQNNSFFDIFQSNGFNDKNKGILSKFAHNFDNENLSVESSDFVELQNHYSDCSKRNQKQKKIRNNSEKTIQLNYLFQNPKVQTFQKTQKTKNMKIDEQKNHTFFNKIQENKNKKQHDLKAEVEHKNRRTVVNSMRNARNDVRNETKKTVETENKQTKIEDEKEIKEFGDKKIRKKVVFTLKNEAIVKQDNISRSQNCEKTSKNARMKTFQNFSKPIEQRKSENQICHKKTSKKQSWHAPAFGNLFCKQSSILINSSQTPMSKKFTQLKAQINDHFKQNKTNNPTNEQPLTKIKEQPKTTKKNTNNKFKKQSSKYFHSLFSNKNQNCKKMESNSNKFVIESMTPILEKTLREIIELGTSAIFEIMDKNMLNENSNLSRQQIERAKQYLLKKL